MNEDKRGVEIMITIKDGYKKREETLVIFVVVFVAFPASSVENTGQIVHPTGTLYS